MTTFVSESRSLSLVERVLLLYLICSDKENTYLVITIQYREAMSYNKEMEMESRDENTRGK